MKKRYYDTCPDCGAHLDPNEQCDCQMDELRSCSTCEGSDNPASCPAFCGDNSLTYTGYTPKKEKKSA